jgi:uncharacterized membrane protein (UPF0127 family)
MPKASGEKTKSEHKAPEGDLSLPQWRVRNKSAFLQKQKPRLLLSWATKHKSVVWYSLAICAAVFLILAPSIFYKPATAELKVTGHTISLEIASDNTSREKGLGGRDSLPANKGMLFVFEKSGDECFWMKNMHFAIDMVFLNAQKKINKIQQNVSPGTFPENFCAENVCYVIELPANKAVLLGLHPGQILIF